jgi:hypothetical protein
MAPDLHAAGRWLHLASGFAAVGLGLAVMLLPKFGRFAGWHRWAGRLYAALIAAAASLGAALAYRRSNTYLTILGGVTFAVVAAGWLAALSARAATARGDRRTAADRLRLHIILMGASYVGAWSGFFATNPVFGTDSDAILLVYVFGPSIVGAVVIARSAMRLNRAPALTSLAVSRPADTRPRTS